jgi:DnaJ-class molecular chaperone with C-terminal Zn finger domain
MPRLILLILIGLGLWYGWQYLKSKPPKERKRVFWVFGVSAVLILSVLLFATGRMHWIGVAIAALIPLSQTLLHWLIRLAPIARLMGRNMGPSTLSTNGIKATFNFATGEVQGEIKTGPYAGSSLNALTREQLEEQLAYFQQNDKQSAMLLKAYMLRAGKGDFDQSRGGSRNTVETGSMTRQEAFLVLGLTEGADKDAIKQAHKRLIQKIHPDRGGNEYLAAKINQARDVLLGG